MPVLLDTNILVRTLQPGHPNASIAEHAVTSLRGRGETLWVCAQNLMELWAVATRPTSENGLGLSSVQTVREITAIKRHFRLLPETPLYGAWEMLVVTHQVKGKNTHDARLVAAMVQHEVDSILTFNTQDFTRYPQINVLHPQSI